MRSQQLLEAGLCGQVTSSARDLPILYRLGAVAARASFAQRCHLGGGHNDGDRLNTKGGL